MTELKNFYPILSKDADAVIRGCNTVYNGKVKDIPDRLDHSSVLHFEATNEGKLIFDIYEASESLKENQHRREHTVICPYCDHKHEIGSGSIYQAGKTHEFECEDCGEVFDLTVENIRYYSTKRIWG